MAKQQGTRIVFVGFPEAAIQGIPSREALLRGKIQSSFPEIPYFYLEDTAGLKFPDLVHLDLPSTQRFVVQVLLWVRGLPQATPAASTTPGRP
jgi:hypothetical protein